MDLLCLKIYFILISSTKSGSLISVDSFCLKQLECLVFLSICLFRLIFLITTMELISRIHLSSLICLFFISFLFMEIMLSFYSMAFLKLLPIENHRRPVVGKPIVDGFVPKTNEVGRRSRNWVQNLGFSERRWMFLRGEECWIRPFCVRSRLVDRQGPNRWYLGYHSILLIYSVSFSRFVLFSLFCATYKTQRHN